VILQRAANRQGGLAAAAATRVANAEGASGQPQLHKNSFKCSKCHRVSHFQGPLHPVGSDAVKHSCGAGQTLSKQAMT